jgi:DNA-binding LacI/PurR family transcriptional regulator
MAGRNTFQDIARLARVSTSTVSRIANKSAKVSAKVEKRVRDAAQQLGVSLYRRKSEKLIAFLLSNRSLTHPFHSQVLVSAEEYCAERGYNVLFFPCHYRIEAPSSQIHIPHILGRTDFLSGFIVTGVNSEGLLNLLTDIGLPFSIYANTIQGRWNVEEHDRVWVDDVTGAYELTRYLQTLGHKTIWYLTNLTKSWFLRRAEGYRRAMIEGNLLPSIESVESEDEREVGFLATKKVILRSKHAQALFCGSDAICHGAYAALRDAGCRVPHDISVAGFNDTLEATVLHPPLTTVRAFPQHVGRTLAELVLNRIDKPNRKFEERIVPTQVIPRQSCVLLINRDDNLSDTSVIAVSDKGTD